MLYKCSCVRASDSSYYCLLGFETVISISKEHVGSFLEVRANTLSFPFRHSHRPRLACISCHPPVRLSDDISLNVCINSLNPIPLTSALKMVAACSLEHDVMLPSTTQRYTWGTAWGGKLWKQRKWGIHTFETWRVLLNVIRWAYRMCVMFAAIAVLSANC